MSEQLTSLQVEAMGSRVGRRRKSSSSLLTRYLLEEYAKRENEAAACKSLYEKAYIGAYGSKEPVLSQVLHDVLPRDSTVYLFNPCGRDICPAFVSFFGWLQWRRGKMRPLYFMSAVRPPFYHRQKEKMKTSWEKASVFECFGNALIKDCAKPVKSWKLFTPWSETRSDTF